MDKTMDDTVKTSEEASKSAETPIVTVAAEQNQGSCVPLVPVPSLSSRFYLKFTIL